MTIRLQKTQKLSRYTPEISKVFDRDQVTERKNQRQFMKETGRKLWQGDIALLKEVESQIIPYLEDNGFFI